MKNLKALNIENEISTQRMRLLEIEQVVLSQPRFLTPSVNTNRILSLVVGA
jgi:hypothetical protein